MTGVPLDLGSSSAPLETYHRDYLCIAAWLFAFLFGPALIVLVLLLAS